MSLKAYWISEVSREVLNTHYESILSFGEFLYDWSVVYISYQNSCPAVYGWTAEHQSWLKTVRFLSDYFRFKDTLRGFWPLIVRWSNVLTCWFPLCLFYACTQRCHTHSSACFMLLCWKNMPWNHNISHQDKEEASINGMTCMLNCNAKCIDHFFCSRPYSQLFYYYIIIIIIVRTRKYKHNSFLKISFYLSFVNKANTISRQTPECTVGHLKVFFLFVSSVFHITN